MPAARARLAPACVVCGYQWYLYHSSERAQPPSMLFSNSHAKRLYGEDAQE